MLEIAKVITAMDLGKFLNSRNFKKNKCMFW